MDETCQPLLRRGCPQAEGAHAKCLRDVQGSGQLTVGSTKKHTTPWHQTCSLPVLKEMTWIKFFSSLQGYVLNQNTLYIVIFILSRNLIQFSRNVQIEKNSKIVVLETSPSTFESDHYIGRLNNFPLYFAKYD